MKEMISKFSPGVFILLLGLGVFTFGATGDQDSIFIIASIAIAISGVITILNAVRIINNKISIIVAAILFLLSSYLTFENYHSIDEPIQFMKEKQVRYAEVIQNLKDLRQIELVYKKEHKKFMGNLDSLMNFIENDSVSTIIKDGEIPDSLVGNEAKAIALGIIIRDTVIHPAKSIAFAEDYLKTRDPRFPVNIESLRYVPYSDNVEFSVDAGSIVRSSGAKVQVFEISDTAPFDPSDVMRVGSMIDPTTSGNWKEEK